MDKKIKKKVDGECYFCGEKDYVLLDCHRIIEGSNGGKYTEYNTLTTCCLCHRKIHAGKISIHGRYFCSNGRYVLHFTEDGKEQWK